MKWFLNLSTMAKLISAFVLVSAMTGIVGWIGASNMARINSMLNTLYERDMLGLQDLEQARTHLATVGRLTALTALTTDPAERAEHARAAEEAAARLKRALEEAEPTLVSEEGKAKLAKIRDLLPKYMATVQEAATHAQSGKLDLARASIAAANPLRKELAGLLDEAAGLKEKLGKEAYEESDVVYEGSRTSMIAIVVAGMIAGLAFGIIIARIIAVPLGKAVSILDGMASGDFTRRLDVDTRDEVGRMAQAMNQAAENIQRALREVRDVAATVAASAQQLSAAAEEISSGAQEQASSLEETASTLEEITSTVRQNSENAMQANQLASGSRDVAEKGGAVVGDAVSAMGEINHASKRIADIITAIDEIAFQTNLLALNAAVEAARAGEQGRGFAVVAAEVRNLAQRSATAAKEIKGLIQDSVRKVEIGSELVNRSGQTLQEIVASVKRVTDIVAEIAAASGEQAAGIEQVNKAVAQMDQVTQANASQTEELSSTAESMSAQAEQLQALVARFVLGDEGARPAASRGHGHAAAPARPARPAGAALAANGPAYPSAAPRRVAAAGGAGAAESHFEEF